MAATADTPGYFQNPSRPRFVPPAGSWDTQAHVFRPGGLGADPQSAYRPVEAPIAALNAMHAAIGIDRGVLVQNLAEALNYDVLIADLDANPRLRAIAVMRGDGRGIETSDAELERLDLAGVCGIRFPFVAFMKRAPSMDFFRRTVERITPLGWHVAVHIEPRQVIELGPVFRSLPLPVVINHQGGIDVSRGLDQPELQALLELHRRDNIWLQLSGGDRRSVVGRPSYADAVPIGRAMVNNAPDRVIWASDWPHVQYRMPGHPEPLPDPGALLNLACDYAPDSDRLEKLLVTNPARLFDAKRGARAVG